jgi:N-acetylneuraminic acid mutarotase
VRTRIGLALTVAAIGACAAVSAALAGSSRGDAIAVSSSTKRWQPLAHSPFNRAEVAAARVGHYIYTLGGFIFPSPGHTPEVARYNIRTDRWRTVAPLPIMLNHTAAAAAGGKLYVHGGRADLVPDSATTRLFRYDPGKDRWTELARSNEPRAAHALGAIKGKLFSAGGEDATTGELTSMEIYDIKSDTWTSGPSMSFGRNHVAGAVANGDFFVFGGRPPLDPGLTVAERYDPESGTWSTLPPMNVPRSGIAAATVDRGIVVFGGENGAPPPATGTVPQVELYDPVTNRWELLPDMRTPRHGLGGASKGNRVYALEGGDLGGADASKKVEFLDVP